MFQLSARPLFDDRAIVVALVGLVLLGLLWLGPARSRTTPRRRWALSLLRLASIALVLLVMLRPTVVYTTIKRQSATLMLLLDQSRSMNVPDTFGNRTRWQTATEALLANRARLDALSQDLTIKLCPFDAEVAIEEYRGGELPLPQQAAGEETAIGAALAEILRREAGQRLAGVILLTDGAQKAVEPHDVSPQGPARTLRDLGCPLYPIVVGQSAGLGQVRDVALIDLAAPSSVFIKNELLVNVTLRAESFAGQDIPVQLQWEDAQGGMEIVDAAVVRPVRDAEQVSTQLSYTPTVAGEYRLRVVVEPQRGETVTTNNLLTTYVTVQGGGLNVLYLEGRNLPEQKFVRRALGESQFIHVDFFRIDATRKQTRPADLAQRLERGRYDVYILGDIDASVFETGELKTLVATLQESQGVGLLMLGGAQSFGPGGYFNTPLADVLPVKMDRFERQNLGEPIRRDVHLPGPITMRPTPLGLQHYVMALGNQEQTAQSWGEMPPLDGANKLEKTSTAAVLAETPQKAPLLLAGNSGNGRVMALAIDSTWRWVLAGKGEQHRRFWRQLVLWLASKDQAQDGAVWVRPEQRRFPPGARVPFTAGAMSPHGEPVADAQLAAELVLPDRSRKTIRLLREGEHQAGLALETRQPGEYTLEVVATQGGTALGTAAARFEVYAQDLELDNPAADPTAMAALAAMTGGEKLSPEQLPELLDRLAEIPKKLEIEEQTRRELYDNGWVILLLLLLWGTEWFLRKRWGLV